MKLIIENQHLKRTDYECEIYINEEKIDTLLWEEDADRIEVECEEDSRIHIEFVSIIFKESGMEFCTFMYWILVLLTKEGEQYQFKIPSHALLIIEDNKSDINIKTSPFSESDGFMVEGDCKVITNRYYVPDSFFFIPMKGKER